MRAGAEGLAEQGPHAVAVAIGTAMGVKGGHGARPQAELDPALSGAIAGEVFQHAIAMGRAAERQQGFGDFTNQRIYSLAGAGPARPACFGL